MESLDFYLKRIEETVFTETIKREWLEYITYELNEESEVDVRDTIKVFEERYKGHYFSFKIFTIIHEYYDEIINKYL